MQHKRVMMHPRQRSACDPPVAELPADAPLVERTARNLPPVEYLVGPGLYSPKV